MIRGRLRARARPRPIVWLRRRLGRPAAPIAVYVCQACYAHGRGRPPHGWGNPCPHAMANAEAYRARQDAERMAFVRQGQRDSEIGRAHSLWARQYEDDD